MTCTCFVFRKQGRPRSKASFQEVARLKRNNPGPASNLLRGVNYRKGRFLIYTINSLIKKQKDEFPSKLVSPVQKTNKTIKTNSYLRLLSFFFFILFIT